MEGLIEAIFTIENLCKRFGIEIILEMEELVKSFKYQGFILYWALGIILLFINRSTGLKSGTEQAIF